MKKSLLAICAAVVVLSGCFNDNRESINQKSIVKDFVIERGENKTTITANGDNCIGAEFALDQNIGYEDIVVNGDYTTVIRKSDGKRYIDIAGEFRKGETILEIKKGVQATVSDYVKNEEALSENIVKRSGTTLNTEKFYIEEQRVITNSSGGGSFTIAGQKLQNVVSLTIKVTSNSKDFTINGFTPYGLDRIVENTYGLINDESAPTNFLSSELLKFDFTFSPQNSKAERNKDYTGIFNVEIKYQLKNEDISSLKLSPVNIFVRDTELSYLTADIDSIKAAMESDSKSSSYSKSLDIAPAQKSVPFKGWTLLYTKAQPDGKIDLKDLAYAKANRANSAKLSGILAIPKAKRLLSDATILKSGLTESFTFYDMTTLNLATDTAKIIEKLDSIKVNKVNLINGKESLNTIDNGIAKDDGIYEYTCNTKIQEPLIFEKFRIEKYTGSMSGDEISISEIELNGTKLTSTEAISIYNSPDSTSPAKKWSRLYMGATGTAIGMKVRYEVTNEDNKVISNNISQDSTDGRYYFGMKNSGTYTIKAIAEDNAVSKESKPITVRVYPYIDKVEFLPVATLESNKGLYALGSSQNSYYAKVGTAITFGAVLYSNGVNLANLNNAEAVEVRNSVINNITLNVGNGFSNVDTTGSSVYLNSSIVGKINKESSGGENIYGIEESSDYNGTLLYKVSYKNYLNSALIDNITSKSCSFDYIKMPYKIEFLVKAIYSSTTSSTVAVKSITASAFSSGEKRSETLTQLDYYTEGGNITSLNRNGTSYTLVKGSPVTPTGLSVQGNDFTGEITSPNSISILTSDINPTGHRLYIGYKIFEDATNEITGNELEKIKKFINVSYNGKNNYSSTNYLTSSMIANASYPISLEFSMLKDKLATEEIALVAKESRIVRFVPCKLEDNGFSERLELTQNTTGSAIRFYVKPVNQINEIIQNEDFRIKVTQDNAAKRFAEGLVKGGYLVIDGTKIIRSKFSTTLGYLITISDGAIVDGNGSDVLSLGVGVDNDSASVGIVTVK